MASPHCSGCACGAAVPGFSTEHARDSNITVSVAPETMARHQELMTTNEPPQEAEHAFIRAVMSPTDARLADVEKEILGLRRRLQQLEDERASLSKYRAQNNAVFSPLRRMPPEILAEIFSWMLPSSREGLDRRKFDTNNSPWVLTHISSRWRAVALSTSALWSRFDINCNRRHANPLSMLKTQIERAQTLKISFRGSGKKPAGPQIEIFRLLAEQSLRWEELNITLTSHLLPLLDTLRNRLPLLRKAWVHWLKSTESQPGVASIDFFQPAPSLLDVGINIRPRYLPVSLPASQLTQYSLNAPWRVHADILKLTTSLVQVRVVVTVNEDPWPEPNIINLTSLRRLWVSHSAVLDYLRAPALHGIGIGHTQNPEVRSLLPFVSRSSCNPTRVALRGAPHSDQLTEILCTVPSIVELDMIFTKVGVTIPEIIWSTTVAPQLRCISFGWEKDCYAVDYALSLKVLQSRWNADNCALKAASLLHVSGTGPDPATLQALAVLRQEGLDLSLVQGIDASDAICASIYRSSWY